MPKIANSTCVSCHQILPRTEMEQVTIVENSGSSRGLSGKLFPSANGKRNVRASARQYYRNKKVWMCHPCAKEHRKKDTNKVQAFVLIAIVVLGYFLYTDKEQADNLRAEKEALISTTAADISTELEVLTLEEFIKWSNVLSKNWVLQGEQSMKGSSCKAQVNRNNNGVIKTIEISNCNNVPKNIESAFKNSIKRAIERSAPIPLIKNEKDQSFITTFKI